MRNDSIHDYNTRQKSKLWQPVAKREYMYRNFSFIGVYVWNHITSKANINIATTYQTFNYSLKQYLLQNEVTLRVI